MTLQSLVWLLSALLGAAVVALLLAARSLRSARRTIRGHADELAAAALAVQGATRLAADLDARAKRQFSAIERIVAERDVANQNYGRAVREMGVAQSWLLRECHRMLRRIEAIGAILAEYEKEHGFTGNRADALVEKAHAIAKNTKPDAALRDLVEEYSRTHDPAEGIGAPERVKCEAEKLASERERFGLLDHEAEALDRDREAMERFGASETPEKARV